MTLEWFLFGGTFFISMKSIFAEIFAALVVLLLAATFSFAADKTGVLKDHRDGKTYKTVKIDDQVWMSENLNFDYNHGSAKSMCWFTFFVRCILVYRLDPSTSSLRDFAQDDNVRKRPYFFLNSSCYI